MKAEVLTEARSETVVRVRISTLVLGAVIMVLLFSIVYVRQMTIRSGYEISSMMQHIEQQQIQYSEMLDKKSSGYDTEQLYSRAKQLGMVLPDVKRTFYVKE